MSEMIMRTASGTDRVVLIRNTSQGTVLGDAIRVAETRSTRRRGLLGSSGLKSGEGMWIVPCPGVHTFAMRFSLDLVYIDRSRRVRKIVRDLPPGRISFCVSAGSVLELPAGAIAATRTAVGDQLTFESPKAGTTPRNQSEIV
jgi:uncharacterized membrane protein (UPF0127 family)